VGLAPEEDVFERTSRPFYRGRVTWMPKQDIHSDDPIQNAKIWNIIE